MVFGHDGLVQLGRRLQQLFVMAEGKSLGIVSVHGRSLPFVRKEKHYREGRNRMRIPAGSRKVRITWCPSGILLREGPVSNG